MLTNMMRDAILDLLNDMINTSVLQRGATAFAVEYVGKEQAPKLVEAFNNAADQFVRELRR